MSYFAALLGNLVNLDRRIIDRTGLSGVYDFRLEFAKDSTFQGPAIVNGESRADIESTATNPDGDSIFIALQKQLGLKLSPGRAPVNVFVIDRVDPPTEN